MIVRAVRAELRDFDGIDAAPALARMSRCRAPRPKYAVGCADRGIGWSAGPRGGGFEPCVGLIIGVLNFACDAERRVHNWIMTVVPVLDSPNRS